MPIQIGQRLDHDIDQPLGLLTDCHRRIEYFLDVLVTLDWEVAGGPLTPAYRRDLETALTYFATSAVTHTADEEESLFPRLRALEGPAAARAIQVIARLERDHEDADIQHRAVDALGRRWLANGQLAPAEAAALRVHLTALHALYRQHLGVEDHDLFPAAARLLSASQLVEVGREMTARRTRHESMSGRTASAGTPGPDERDRT